jgi:hypothetical protein
MKLRGELTVVYDTNQVTADFRRRNIIVQTNDRGNIEQISLELFQDHCNKVDNFGIGDAVVVDFELKGRKWTDKDGVVKYFNTLQAWKITPDTEMDSE